MLHDPRHDKTFTLASFALFVASQPEDKSYDWSHADRCAVGLCLQSLGMETPYGSWHNNDDIRIANQLAQGDQVHSDWTFGKLADRILAHQMEHA